MSKRKLFDIDKSNLMFHNFKSFMQRYKKNVIYANIPHFILVKNTKFNSLSIKELYAFVDTA